MTTELTRQTEIGYVEGMNKLPNDPILKVSAAMVEKIRHRMDLDAQIKKLTAERESIDSELRIDMESHGALVCVHRRLTLAELQETRRRIIDSKRLRSEEPSLAEKYTKESVSRHLHYVA